MNFNEKILNKYLGRKIIIRTRAGFAYTLILRHENIEKNILSFKNAKGELVCLDIGEITFITTTKGLQLTL